MPSLPPPNTTTTFLLLSWTRFYFHVIPSATRLQDPKGIVCSFNRRGEKVGEGGKCHLVGCRRYVGVIWSLYIYIGVALSVKSEFQVIYTQFWVGNLCGGGGDDGGWAAKNYLKPASLDPSGKYFTTTQDPLKAHPFFFISKHFMGRPFFQPFLTLSPLTHTLPSPQETRYLLSQ